MENLRTVWAAIGERAAPAERGSANVYRGAVQPRRKESRAAENNLWLSGAFLPAGEIYDVRVAVLRHLPHVPPIRFIIKRKERLLAAEDVCLALGQEWPVIKRYFARVRSGDIAGMLECEAFHETEFVSERSLRRCSVAGPAGEAVAFEATHRAPGPGHAPATARRRSRSNSTHRQHQQPQLQVTHRSPYLAAPYPLSEAEGGGGGGRTHRTAAGSGGESGEEDEDAEEDGSFEEDDEEDEGTDVEGARTFRRRASGASRRRPSGGAGRRRRSSGARHAPPTLRTARRAAAGGVAAGGARAAAALLRTARGRAGTPLVCQDAGTPEPGASSSSAAAAEAEARRRSLRSVRGGGSVKFDEAMLRTLAAGAEGRRGSGAASRRASGSRSARRGSVLTATGPGIAGPVRNHPIEFITYSGIFRLFASGQPLTARALAWLGVADGSRRAPDALLDPTAQAARAALQEAAARFERLRCDGGIPWQTLQVPGAGQATTSAFFPSQARPPDPRPGPARVHRN
eukprot:tig00020603_g11738.t1